MQWVCAESTTPQFYLLSTIANLAATGDTTYTFHQKHVEHIRQAQNSCKVFNVALNIKLFHDNILNKKKLFSDF